MASGVDGGHPDTWPIGRSVLFFDVFGLFNTTKGAQKVEKASEQNLKSHGFSPVSDSPLGSGERSSSSSP